jgi:hypothetical protein
MAKFRLRNLINKNLTLDGWRLSFLAWFCNHGSDFFGRSFTVTKIISPGSREYLEGDKPAIFAVYHGRIIGLLHVMTNRKIVSILISQSRDGEIISRALTELGFSTTRGSTKRGAVQGAMQTVKAAKANQYPVVVVDGPRGPIWEIKSGILKMAELTGIPIIPYTCSARTFTTFGGWDKFMGSNWGSPEVFLYGEPIFVPEGSTDEELKVLYDHLDEKMQSLREQADTYYKCVPV